MKKLALPLAVALMASGAPVAQAQPALVTGPPETVYSDAQRAQDQTTSRHVVETMLAPAFSIEDQYARWKRPICPHVYGLTPTAAYFIERRIKEIAAVVGAPVDRDDPCIANIGIIFTVQPQATLDSIADKQPLLILGGSRRLAVKYPVQAWYTDFKTDHHGTTTLDVPWEDMNTQTPTQSSSMSLSPSDLDAPAVAANVSRLHTGLTSVMAAATILVDSGKVQGMTLGTLADYLALLSLTQAEITGECLDRPTIANLMVPGCDASVRATALSNVDVALMSALYSVPDIPERLQKQRIIGAMRRSLEGQFGKR